MAQRIHSILLPLAAFCCLAFTLSGCSKPAPSTKTEDQTQQDMRKNKVGD